MATLIAVMQILTAASILAIRYRSYGFGDPLFLFTGAFVLYNSSVLLQFAGDATQTGSFFTYIRIYSSHELILAGITSLFALFGMWISAVVLAFLQRRQTVYAPPVISAARSVRNLFWIGFAAVTLFLLVYVAVIIATVGLVNFLGSVRTGSDRINPSTVLGIGIPLPPLAIAGFAAMLLGYAVSPSKRRKRILTVVLTVFVLFNFLQGSRHLIAYLIIMAIGTYATFVPIKVTSPHKLILIGTVLYSVFVIVSKTRSTLISYFAGTVTLDQWFDLMRQFSWRWLLPVGNEFGGVYLTLLETVNASSPLLLGRTYIEAILYILPTRLYPGVKPVSLGHEFAISISQQYEWLAGIGFGFSPVAEAYLNLGLAGIPVAFMLLAFMLHRVGSLRRRGMAGVLVYLVLLGQMVNANRYSLDGVLQEAAFSVAIILFFLALARIR